MTSQVQNFINLLDKIKPSKHRHEIFNDWLIVAAATLYAPWKKDKSVEDEYMQIAKQYSADELQQFSKLLAMTVEALEEKEHDFLGEVFTIGNLTNSRSGQFFTPFNVSQLIADISISEKDCSKNRVIQICDPCCGAGGMLIAGAAVMKKRDINYQQDVFFTGIDIDPRCARMTFIQLSLLAAPAVVICGNSLLPDAVYWQKETIGYYIAGMEFRLKFDKMRDLMVNCEPQEAGDQEKKTENKVITLPSAWEYEQGELF